MRIVLVCRDGPKAGWNEEVDVTGLEDVFSDLFHRWGISATRYVVTDEVVESPKGPARVLRYVG